jgi:hypothetical protein
MLGLHKIEYPRPNYVTSTERNYQTFLKSRGLGAAEGPSTGLKLVLLAAVGVLGYTYYSCVQRGACAGFTQESKRRYLLERRGRAY